MSKQNKVTESKSPHDVITYTQHIIMNIDRNQRMLVDKYDKIVQALADKIMTAQEVHALYLDYRSVDFNLTIKSVYRYLNILKEANLVAIAGYRITPGKRIFENLYSLSAKYYHLGHQVGDFWELGDSRQYSDNMSELLGSVLKSERLTEMSNKQLLHQLNKYESIIDVLNITEIYHAMAENEKLMEYLPEDFFDRQEFLQRASRLLMYLRNFDNIRQFKENMDDIII